MLGRLSSAPSRSHSISTKRSNAGASAPVVASLVGKRRFAPARPMHVGPINAQGTLEREPIRFVMPTPTCQAPKLDDGGDGGANGRNNRNGGGGGDGGGNNDDDDFFSEEEGDGEGAGGGGQGSSAGGFFATVAVAESYDKLSIAAVFAEWMRTVADLPMIIRRAVEMGLFSSAQLVRFFSMDVRPGVARAVTRSLPPAVAREFVGRMMADPAFAQKLAIETLLAASASLFYEWRVRGDRFAKELDLAAINTLGLTGATAATVWLLAPTRSYGTLGGAKFPFQQMLQGLPNCIFDISGPLRQYSGQARIGSLFAKAAELSAVGAAAGAVTTLASSAAVELRRRDTPFGPGDASFQPSVPVPEINRSSGGLGAFFAVNANLRYQLIGGLDRVLFGHANFLWTYLGLSGAVRVASMAAGELSRPWFQGLPDVPESHKKVVTRRVSKKVPRKVPKASVLAAVEVNREQQEGLASVSFAAASAGEADFASSMEGEGGSGAVGMPMEASRPSLSLATEIQMVVSEATQLTQSHMGAREVSAPAAVLA